MKFKIVLKDPDGVYESLKDHALKTLHNTEGLDAAEKRVVLSERIEELQEAIKAWVEYGEYVNIEIDTEAGTATVVKA